ncbi:MAG: OmpA family protein [Gammaproteobacteria bacterium]|nr:OmpA family protein [Gammaproteobacteria bacterium]
MKIITGLFRLSLLSAIIVLAGCASSQPKLTQEQILDQYPQVVKLDSAVKKSKSEGAALFAPDGYDKITDALESAMDAAHNNKKESANEAAAEGLRTIDKLNRNTQKSRQILSEVLIVRERAISAGVVTMQVDKLTEMDERLKETSALIEDNKIEEAKQLRPKLIEGYTQLELATLKQGTSDLAKSAITDAKEYGAEKHAPKTLAQAEEKLALAITILESDRTQTEKANTQAKNAKWLAEKSSSISETVKDFERRDYSMEDVVLWYQQQLNIVNEPIGGQLSFNESNDDMVQTFKNTVNQLKAAEVEYEEKLELTELDRAVAQQKEREEKEKFEKVQAMFSAKEANVFRQHENVLIAAHGFNFPSGQSEIQAGNFPLMNKIIRAIKIFPNSRIGVTGHTDSTGSDGMNQAVSQARAEKVAKFLIEVGELSKSRIKTFGYGERRPVATNKTAEGRAENRRVEINIINE